MSDHIETRKKIKGIASVSTFNDLLNQSTLSEEDKTVLRLYYLQGKDLSYIADTLGYSLSTIKKRHKKSLQKLSRIL